MKMIHIAINEVARREGVTPEYVYAEMQSAIQAGFNNPDPAVRARWAKLAPDGKIPTPEKVIAIFAKIERIRTGQERYE